MSDSAIPISMYQLVYDWAKYTDRDMSKMMDKKHIGVSGVLKSSKRFSVTGSADDVSKATFSMLDRGKFSDMGVGRGQPLGDVKGNNAIYKAAGLKGRTAKKFIFKTIFPEANTLLKLIADNYGKKIFFEINESVSDSITLEM